MDIVPFAGIQTRFRGVAPGPRDKRERELICSAHCSKDRLVILRPPFVPNSFRTSLISGSHRNTAPITTS
jgi:hypothetical protein